MCRSIYFTEQYNPSPVHLKLPCVSKLTLQASENTGCRLIKNAHVLPCLPCSTHPGRNSNPVKSLLQLLDKNTKHFLCLLGPRVVSRREELLYIWRKWGKPVKHTAMKEPTYIYATLEVQQGSP